MFAFYKIKNQPVKLTDWDFAKNRITRKLTLLEN